MKTFADTLPQEEQEKVNAFRKAILDNDPTVTEETGNVMSSKGSLNYMQEGVFKYSLAKTDKHFSFHTMVMYSYPEIADEVKPHVKKVKFQKGCINFKQLDDFPIDVFADMIRTSAAKDFSPVIEKYKKKK